jgi:hypothetical protein
MLELLEIILQDKIDLEQIYVQSGKVPKKVFKYYVANDDTPTKKYVQWMCKQYTINPSEAYHYPDIAREFDKFSKRKKLAKTDIYQYQAKELEQELSALRHTKSKRQEKEEVKQGAEVVYEDEQLLIIHPTTTESSCLYGKGTKWCISTKDLEDSMFPQYRKRGNKFYFIIDKVRNKKFAVQVKLDGEKIVWTSRDAQITWNKLLSLVPELKRVTG